MENKTKKIAVSGYYGFDNFGDEAILAVLTKKLNEMEYDVNVFSKNPEKTSNKLGVNSIYTFDLKNLIKTLKEVDVLISGGGSLLQDSTSLKSLLYYLFVIFNAEVFKKKVIIFAQGIGPINNPLGRLLTKTLLKKCSYICVRDAKSQKFLADWNVKADLVNDPVWNIDVNEYIPMNRVGVQLRSWNGLDDKYITKIASLVAQNFSDKEIYIYSFQDALDYDLCKNFEARLKLENPNIKTVLLGAMDIDKTVQSFANLDCLVGMRYHACLLALKYNIPTLAISYDEKVSKIAKRFDLPCSQINDLASLEECFAKLKNLDMSTAKEKIKDCIFDFEKVINTIENN